MLSIKVNCKGFIGLSFHFSEKINIIYNLSVNLILALRQQKPLRFLPPNVQSGLKKKLLTEKRFIPHTASSGGDHSTSGLGRSQAQGETCLFKRKSSKGKRKVMDVSQQKQLNAEVFANRTIFGENEKPEVGDKSKPEGSTCTLYVGPNKVPLRIKCEFVEYI